MDSLDISDVANRTGLTARALRFYEARGLVQPLRTANGRRHYGAGELARLTAIVALKRAGFTLAAIQRLLAGRETNLGRLVAAQIAEVDAARPNSPTPAPCWPMSCPASIAASRST
uniref:MerR family transcriptional regulator n=1 Tax=Sphingomonas sp. TaxID=28214 RepID=UPI0025E2A82E|nr:MerR family transcriptional regulator [Sphingomonas sp.]